MTEVARMIRPPELDEPLRRLIWEIPAAIAIWAIVLGGFSAVLTRTAVPPAELKPLEARLVEIPLEAAPLRPAAAPRPAAPVLQPKLRPAPALKPRTLSHPKETLAPPVVRSPYGTKKSTEAPTLEAPAPSEDVGEQESRGEGAGSDTVGARAIYSPTPEIPDDLREDVIETEAVARFTVSYDGTATVTLEKPTSNQRLNHVLLDTLKQWKFSAAITNGIPIDSSFELRIPISVQ